MGFDEETLKIRRDKFVPVRVNQHVLMHPRRLTCEPAGGPQPLFRMCETGPCRRPRDDEDHGSSNSYGDELGYQDRSITIREIFHAQCLK